MTWYSIGSRGKEELAGRKYGPCVAGEIRKVGMHEPCSEMAVVVRAPCPERRGRWHWHW